MHIPVYWHHLMLIELTVNIMEDIVKSPGLQHIIKTTLTFLDKHDIASFRLVNQYCKNIVNDPIFFLKKIVSTQGKTKGPN